MTQWYLHPIFDRYLVVAACGLVLVLLLFMGPVFGRLTSRRRGVLVGLRLLVTMLVIVAMLRPTLIGTTSQRHSAILILLLDGSRSMQVPDASGGQTRWDALGDAVKSGLPALSELVEEMEVKVYLFDSEARAIEYADGEIDLIDSPEGRQSDIGSALDDVVQRDLNRRLAGVILLSDGAARAYAPRVETHQAARQLARLGYPLYTVAFGLPRERSQARDVAVENLRDHYTVFVKNELAIDALLSVQGFVNKAIPVELLVEDPVGRMEVLGPLELTASQDDQQLKIRMTYIPTQPGQYKLTLRAAQQPGELVTKNNQLSAFLTVLEGGLKVLYLEGEMRHEQNFLRRSIDSSPDIQLDFILIDHRRQLSADLNAHFERPAHDVYIIGDLDSAALGRENLLALARAVSEGRGLIMLGGYHSFGPGGYHDTPLANVLPVGMDRFERQGFDAPIREDLHLAGPLKMLPVGENFVTHLGSGGESRAVWQRLAPLLGSNKFHNLKQNARVLARTPDDDSLLVAGGYGLGRSLAMAGDSTWCWWMKGNEAEHKRFWRQVVIWLARRDELIKNDVWIDLPQRRFNPGSRVSFTAGAKDAGGDVIEGATLTAELIRPDGTREPAQLSVEEVSFTGSLRAAEIAGDYVIEVKALRDAEELGRARAKFTVFDQDLELSDPSANPALLVNLAEITKDAGGRALAPEELPALLRQIKDNPPDLEVQQQTKWRLGDTAPDAWLFFLAVVGLLSGEWFLRKKWRLV